MFSTNKKSKNDTNRSGILDVFNVFRKKAEEVSQQVFNRPEISYEKTIGYLNIIPSYYRTDKDWTDLVKNQSARSALSENSAEKFHWAQQTLTSLENISPHTFTGDNWRYKAELLYCMSNLTSVEEQRSFFCKKAIESLLNITQKTSLENNDMILYLEIQRAAQSSMNLQYKLFWAAQTEASLTPVLKSNFSDLDWFNKAKYEYYVANLSKEPSQKYDYYSAAMKSLMFIDESQYTGMAKRILIISYINSALLTKSFNEKIVNLSGAIATLLQLPWKTLLVSDWRCLAVSQCHYSTLLVDLEERIYWNKAALVSLKNIPREKLTKNDLETLSCCIKNIKELYESKNQQHLHLEALTETNPLYAYLGADLYSLSGLNANHSVASNPATLFNSSQDGRLNINKHLRDEDEIANTEHINKVSKR